MSEVSRKRDGYAKDNTEAARIILSAVASNGGEGSLAVTWARAFLRNATDDRAEAEPNGQGRLFAKEAA